MRFIFTILLLAGLSFGLTNCSDSDDNYINSLNFDNRDDALNSQDSVSITCESGQNCPEYVGGLSKVSYEYIERETYYGKTGDYNWVLGTCSQTLIAANKIITNKHCLPSAMRRKNNSSCSDIHVYFPATANKKFAKVKCKRIVDLSDGTPEDIASQPDWAILEIETGHGRNPVPTNTNGIPHNADIHFYPVYYSEVQLRQNRNHQFIRTLSGTIRRNSCQSKMNAWSATDYIHPHSPVYRVSCDEKTIGGNSGSGIFNSSGQQVGLHSMSSNIEGGGTTVYGKYVSGRQAKIGGGTNLHCIDPLNPSYDRENCRLLSSRSETAAGQFWRTFLNIYLGFEANSQDMEKLRQQVEQDELVEWEPLRRETLEQIDPTEDNENTRELAKHGLTSAYEYTDSWVDQKTSPYSPACVKSENLETDHFQLKWPYFLPMTYEFEVDGKLLYKMPSTIGQLVFDMKYDASSGHYRGQIIRMDQALRRDFQGKRDELVTAFAECVASANNSKCSNYRSKISGFQSFINRLSQSSQSLIANESFVATDAEDDNTLVLPKCN